jgi:pectate lyase
MTIKSGVGLFMGFLLVILMSPSGCLSIPTPVTITPPLPTLMNTTALETDVSVYALMPAFPGAEGFGVTTVGGRGGRVIEVTNLDDAGPGSLRDAVEAEGPRTVVFRLAGTIGLESNLVIANPYITIAGQTAPGEGITLRSMNPAVDAILEIETHDVVIRFLTLRAGPPSAGDGMMILASEDHDTYNIVIDHNSISWAVNRDLATWYDVHDISIQWNIFSEGLDCSIHPKGCHSKGVLLGGYASDENKDNPGAGNLSFHHNLMAHNGERNPLVSMSGVTDVVNNVVYNPFGSFSHVDFQHQLTVIPVNYVGNYFKPGVDTDPGKYGVDIASEAILGAQIFVLGNIDPHRLNSSQPEINIVDPDARPYVVSAPSPVPFITTTSALEAYDQVLAGAGASRGLGCDGAFFSRRDAIDARIVKDVINGTGQIIDDPSEVGGWLTIPPATPCADSDHDGMPDQWEEQQGFDPNDSSDASADQDGDGYTNIEEFLNGTNPID